MDHRTNIPKPSMTFNTTQSAKAEATAAMLAAQAGQGTADVTPGAEKVVRQVRDGNVCFFYGKPPPPNVAPLGPSRLNPTAPETTPHGEARSDLKFRHAHGPCCPYSRALWHL